MASNLVLCTSHGRQLEFGSKGASGSPFAFKAPQGHEVERILFGNIGNVLGIKTAPLVVTWPKDEVDMVRKSFAQAAQAFWPVLLKLSSQMGPRYSNYALLEGRRMGLQDLPNCSSGGAKPSGMSPPSHWDLSAMGGISASGTPNIDVVEIPLGQAEIGKLQQLLNASFQREQATGEEGLAPAGLKLKKASRLQNWPSWLGYTGRQAIIKEELRQLKPEGGGVESITDEMSAATLEALGAALDAEANVRWLFHGITPEAAERVGEREFDIDVAGCEDGMLYGRGIYLTEWCSRVDRSVPEGPEALRCMVLCRATLGNVLRDENVLPDKVRLINHCTGGDHHGVLGDRKERCPGCSRDFVVYDKDQVYPEYLLWYQRVYR